jgi:hypothetical protein
MTTRILTQEELKSQLNYNCDTGVFTWLKTSNSHALKGSIAGHVRSDGRIKINVNSKTYYAHRLAWFYIYGDFPKKHIDHINGNPSDNRICNLRQATDAQNNQNKTKPLSTNKTSKYLGVSFEKKAGKYVAQICKNRKSYRLGYFDNQDEAYETYLKAKRELHEFCTI